MPAFCDEDGYDSPHKDLFFKYFGGPLLTYPMYYHDKNQEVWLTLNPRCYGIYAKRHKIFQSRFLKMAAITLSNFK